MTKYRKTGTGTVILPGERRVAPGEEVALTKADEADAGIAALIAAGALVPTKDGAKAGE